jgi:hypothetical protein
VPNVANWNSVGTATIPARHFFGKTLKDNLLDYKKAVGAIVRLVLRGDVGVDKARRNLGIRGVRDAKKAVDAFSKPPNRPSTIAKKGFDNPLIHTKKMRDAIGWRVER